MRAILILLPLSLCAAPALAQTAPPPAPEVQLPAQVSDPATVDRVTDALQALSKAFLDLPVGNVQAALDGRKPSAADRKRTIGSQTGLSARELQQRIAAARPQIEQGLKAVNQALPQVTADLERARESVERALSNLPDPNYPRR